MQIVGLQKMTLLDYPGKVACTVFLAGCNFRCPFCHNGELLAGEQPVGITEEEFFSFLKSRVGFLDGVCITGGEPTLYPDLPDFIRKIKEMGYPVKLDTNGYRPEVLKGLLAEGLLDYVAMDVKNCPERYAETVGLPEVEIKRLEESISLLLSGNIPYEFRTTLVSEFHNQAAIRKMGEWLVSLAKGEKIPKLFLQGFVDRETVLQPGLHCPTKEEMAGFLAALAPFVQKTELRGID